MGSIEERNLLADLAFSESLEDPLLKSVQESFDDKINGTSLNIETTPTADDIQAEEIALESQEADTVDQIIRESRTDVPDPAKIHELSRVSGLPHETVLQDPKAIEEQAQAQANEVLLKDSPILRNLMADFAGPNSIPFFAELARDDIPNLSFIEQAIKDADVGLTQGFLGRERGLARREITQGLFSDGITQERSDELTSRIAEIGKELHALNISGGSDGFIQAATQAIGSFIKGVPQVLGAGAAAGGSVLLGGALTAGPLAPGVVAAAATVGSIAELFRQSSAVEGGNITQDAIDLGIRQDIAEQIGEAGGIVSGALEALAGKIIAKPFMDLMKRRFSQDFTKKMLKATAGTSAVRASAKTFAAGAGGEVATEVAQQFTSIAAIEAGKALDPKDFESISFGEIMDQASESFTQTLKAMTVLAIPGATVSFFQ